MAKLRFPVACLISAVLVVGLFGFLRALTDTRVSAQAALTTPKMEFVRLRREVEIEEKKREKPEREKPEQKPVTPTLAVASKEGFDPGLDVQAIASGLGAEFGSAGGRGGDGTGSPFGGGLSDRDPLPLVRIEPQYPPQARQRNLEGWVQVQFTISTTGAVKDAVVVKSSNSLFEHNALQAVSKWKYQPQIRGGKPAETAGQQVVLRFRMDS
jgi:periplasmic protein TonB